MIVSTLQVIVTMCSICVLFIAKNSVSIHMYNRAINASLLLYEFRKTIIGNSKRRYLYIDRKGNILNVPYVSKVVSNIVNYYDDTSCSGLLKQKKSTTPF